MGNKKLRFLSPPEKIRNRHMSLALVGGVRLSGERQFS